MRLIDADKLEDHEEIIPFGNGMYESTFVVYKDDIDEQPTVDAVPVIRCKDCKYWNGSGKFCDYEMSGLENDFCSWAERKSE